MFKDFFKDRSNMQRLIVVLIIGAAVFLSISVLTDSSSSKEKTISSSETEATLCSILEGIEGTGKVETMVQRNEEGKVTGVIVTAEGADNPSVKYQIVSGVATLFSISVSDVAVFEKSKQEE